MFANGNSEYWRRFESEEEYLQGWFFTNKITLGWSNWDRSNLDKIDLIGQRSYAIDIQAALTAEPPPINLEQN